MINKYTDKIKKDIINTFNIYFYDFKNYSYGLGIAFLNEMD